MVKEKCTPLMQQFHDIKKEYPDTLLFFQVGDFYELFFDDAKTAAAFLGITLTARGKSKGEPIPLCGVPVHARDHYLTKLVKGGFKVAICDQLEPPSPGRIVKRGVTQVLTPGTLTDQQLLDEKTASYLFAFVPTKDTWALLFGELLTGQLFATTIPAYNEKVLESELIRYFPDEVLLPETSLAKTFQSFFKKQGYYTSSVAKQDEQQPEIDAWIANSFHESIVTAVKKQESLQLALYYFYAYVKKTHENALDHINSLHLYQADDFLILDSATQKNLEIIKNMQDGGRKNTLFSVLDNAATAMGSRMIKKWLLRPLVKQEAIEQRQQAIALLIQEVSMAQQLHDTLQSVGDIERIIGRIALRRGQINDYIGLLRALKKVPIIKQLVQPHIETTLFGIIDKHIGNFHSLEQLLITAINDDSTKDWLIKKGFDRYLDRLRELVHESNEKILYMERTQQEKTGINSLKIRFNQVHGYYIEITKTNLHLVPEHYIQKQMLAGRQRFTTPELQQLQGEIIQARTEIDSVEKQVFERVKVQVVSYISSLRKLSYGLAHLDALLGFSTAAYTNSYVCPQLNTKRIIEVVDGRHPVVEQTLAMSFIPNDTQLDNEQSLWIITGPNMGGKSTYLRQVALHCIMAQCGSFIPAQAANIALLDRIFTRIGAGDNVALGKSTFLVEMEETATICTQATKNSLVILDEVGRGTSTFDGLAIAQSVVEHIHATIKARCLFATHYHELTNLQQDHPGIVSYYAANKKTRDGIVFLYKMIHGVADGSFGVEVAKLAHLPDSVIERAQTLLYTLTNGHNAQTIAKTGGDEQLIKEYERVLYENTQLKHYLDTAKKELKTQQAIKESLGNIDYEGLSPKQAFDFLWQLKEKQCYK